MLLSILYCDTQFVSISAAQLWSFPVGACSKISIRLALRRFVSERCLILCVVSHLLRGLRVRVSAALLRTHVSYLCVN